jgi:hypothetical protein
LVVIPSKRFLRSEACPELAEGDLGEPRGCGAFFATQESRVWLASLIKLHHYPILTSYR